MKAGPLGLALPWESDPSQIVRCVFCGGGYCKSCSKEALALCPNPAVTGNRHSEIDSFLSSYYKR